MLIRHSILGSVAVAAIAARSAAVPWQSNLATAPQPAGVCAAEVRELIEDGRSALAEEKLRLLIHPAVLEGREVTREASELLRLLARTMCSNGKQRDPETLRLSELAVAIAVEAAGNPSLEVAENLLQLGYLHYLLGDLPAARIAFEQALGQRESLLGPADPRGAHVLTFLGCLAAEERDIGKAEDFFGRARAIQDWSLPSDDLDVAFRSSREAIFRYRDEDYSGARAGHEHALAIYERLLRPRHPSIAVQHHNLGVLYSDECDWANARRHFEEALDIRLTELGENHLNTAWTMTLLANLRDYLGEKEEAYEDWLASIDVLRKSLGPTDRRLLLPLQGMARRDLAANDLVAAQESLDRAREIHAAKPGADPWIEELGAEIVYQRGDRNEAIEQLRRALADAPQADLLETLGKLLARGDGKGELEEGVELLRRALEVSRQEFPGDNPRPSWVQDQFAEALYRARRLDEALAQALEAETSARNHLRATATRLEERTALSSASHAMPGLSLSLRIAAAQPTTDRPTRVWDGLLRSRSIVFAEMVERRRLATLSRDPTIGSLARALADARDRYAGLAVRGKADPERLAAARLARERAERDLLEASASERASRRREDAGLEEVVRALPSGAALVSFARLTPLVDAPAGYVALVWPAGASAPVVRDLGDADAIDRRVKEALELSRSMAGEARYRRVAAELRERLWDPIEGQLAGAREICIVPDGTLVLLDFSALPVGEDSFLIERTPPIHYLTNERDLLPEPDVAAGRGLLACGGPEFERDPVLLVDAGSTTSAPNWTARGAPDLLTGGLRDLQFGPLPRASSETRAIAALWNRCGKAPEAIVLTGVEATEEAFEENARGREILHLATHGFFLPASTPSSGLAARGVGPFDRPPSTLALDLSLEHSLLSGLAFAGANERGWASGADGILLAEEIAALDLTGVRLVVLSACDTGLGQVQDGEGVFGLRRAFRLAGARTLVTSLWPVVDETAEARMIDFHRRRLEGGESVAQALRSAAMRLLLDRRARGESTHPFHWAGILAVGGRD